MFVAGGFRAIECVLDYSPPEQSPGQRVLCGAVRIGKAPSDAVPGRLLPLYELRLIPRGAVVTFRALPGRQIQALSAIGHVRARSMSLRIRSG